MGNKKHQPKHGEQAVTERTFCQGIDTERRREAANTTAPSTQWLAALRPGRKKHIHRRSQWMCFALDGNLQHIPLCIVVVAGQGWDGGIFVEVGNLQAELVLARL